MNIKKSPFGSPLTCRKNNKNFYFLFFIGVSFFSQMFIVINAVFAATVTLTWNRNLEPDIAGYKIYYGESSGQYNNTITINDDTNQSQSISYNITDLKEGTTYFFAVKAFDLAGQYSEFSDEVSFHIPEPPTGGGGNSPPSSSPPSSSPSSSEDEDVAPVVDADPISGEAPLLVSFVCSANDPEGLPIEEYQWDFDGDGKMDEVSTINTVEYVFTDEGDYNATCVAINTEGHATASDPVTISVNYNGDVPIDTPEEIITQLYVAYYGRKPDCAGLDYWVHVYEHGRSLAEIVYDFAASDEAVGLYPYLGNTSKYSPEELIRSVYNNLFQREPDKEGLKYWMEQLVNGRILPPEMVYAIIEGAKAPTGSNRDKAFLEYKVRKALTGSSCTW